MMMLREIEERVLADGKVHGEELDLLRAVLYADGKIDCTEADFLVELYKRVRPRNPAFDQFFYKAIKDHLLADGRIDAEETAWLRDMLFPKNGRIEDEARKFMHEVKGEAPEVSPEFETLFKQVMKQPPEQHTSK